MKAKMMMLFVTLLMASVLSGCANNFGGRGRGYGCGPTSGYIGVNTPNVHLNLNSFGGFGGCNPGAGSFGGGTWAAKEFHQQRGAPTTTTVVTQSVTVFEQRAYEYAYLNADGSVERYFSVDPGVMFPSVPTQCDTASAVKAPNGQLGYVCVQADGAKYLDFKGFWQHQEQEKQKRMQAAAPKAKPTPTPLPQNGNGENGNGNGEDE